VPTPGQVAKALGFRPAAPSYLPAGYHAAGPPALADCPCGCGGASELRRYSDGLRSFSVFQTDLSRHHCGLAKACRIGQQCGDGCRASDYGPGAAVTRQKGRVTVVAVGDLSVRELRRVVESL
jgi:hypothetical protein